MAEPVDSAAVSAKVGSWLEAIVLGLGLCPFARRPVDDGLLRIAISNADTTQALLEDLFAELAWLDGRSALELETTLLVIPLHLADFLEFNDFLDVAEALLDEYGYTGSYQLASFHPRYQFADTAPADVQNLTNRAPYPILHLLREDSIEVAVSDYPDVEGIPDRNIGKLQSLSAEQRRKLFSYLEDGLVSGARSPER